MCCIINKYKLSILLFLLCILIIIYVIHLIYLDFCKLNTDKCDFTYREESIYYFIIIITTIILLCIFMLIAFNANLIVNKCYLCIQKRCKKNRKSEKRRLQSEYISTRRVSNNFDISDNFNVIGKSIV